jgi:cytochrome c peroxidase
MRHSRLATIFLVWVLVFPPILGSTSAGKAAEKSGKIVPESLWTAAEWATSRTFSPLPPPPVDPTNAWSQNEPAARLGHRLFFDTRLSPKGFACSSCHKPELGFTDGLKVGHTIAPVKRNTMTILNVGQYRWLTWDGARDSLWHQASGPIEDPKEMGSSRLDVIHTVMRHYGPELATVITWPEAWEKLWPTLPASGKPGEPAFDHLSPELQDAVNRVFTSILKVIAAYEMKIVSGPAPFDRFVAGDPDALSLAAQRGFQHFLRLECHICHSTPLFSDDEFHNVGFPQGATLDRGRIDGLAFLQQQPFRGTGPYADGPPVVRAEDYQTGKALIGAFRTPSLRELKSTGPYGHSGVFPTLDDTMEHYEQVTSKDTKAVLGRLDPALPEIRMTDQEKTELVEFLLSLSSNYASEWTRAPAGFNTVP